MFRILNRSFILLAAAGWVAFAAPAPFAAGPGIKPSTVGRDQLQPGLSVLYIHNFHHRHLDKFPTGEKLKRKGKPGKPIPYLNHRFGKEVVFDSGVTRLIGLHMTGYIHLEKPGAHQFKAYINDGIRVYIGEHLIVDEPEWHPDGDRYTATGEASISETGWYPLLIRYFQRKGTATVILYWKKPGHPDFSVIPAEAYAH